MKWQKAGENCILRTFITCTFYPNYQVKEDEIGRACSRNGRKRSAYRILMGTPEWRSLLGGLDVAW
jgi:hypothetical protein